MTSDEVLAAFGRLKTGSRDGQRLPHKPLLVLLALGRWASGELEPIAFAEIEKKLSALLQTYGPRGAGNPRSRSGGCAGTGCGTSAARNTSPPRPPSRRRG